MIQRDAAQVAMPEAPEVRVGSGDGGAVAHQRAGRGDRSGSDVCEERVDGEELTADTVVAAVSALDGDERNDLYLQSDDEATMVVAGGPELCFIYATFDNATFLVPETGRAGDPVEMMAGGRPGIFPPGNLMDKETAVAVAVTWARNRAGHADRLARVLDGDYR